jgi:succinate dehydrogenase / fumarate reductase cytochrome b subunit
MTFPRSTIGKKVIMAVTGLIGIGFLLLHMYGNLKAFGGPAYFNDYAEGLRAFGAPIFGHLHVLMLIRTVLLVSLAGHVWAALALTRQAWGARPVKYTLKKNVQADYAAVTMRWGGLTIFLFLIYHLMHFTWGVPVAPGGFVRGDAYRNMVVGFQFWPATLFYLLAVIALGLHLYHGGWSMFQTLGLTDENTTKPLRALALGLALVISVGFAIVPVAVLVGIIR